jgi:ATP-dependent RNA helicase DDX10/DBP4
MANLNVLDFPSVDWVVQLDCPEDATTYLHRVGYLNKVFSSFETGYSLFQQVGRTARQAAVGKSLLMLLPNEEPGMLTQLRAYKIPVDKIE